MAFLTDGRADLCGKLSNIKTKYSTDEYIIEVVREEDSLLFPEAFPRVRRLGASQLGFSERDHSIFDVMAFSADKRIPLLRLERVEPTLESLFMEVTGR